MCERGGKERREGKRKREVAVLRKDEIGLVFLRIWIVFGPTIFSNTFKCSKC